MRKYTDKEIIESLWDLLDDIDTLSDICKPTIDKPGALMVFYNNTLKLAAKRFEYMKSDGQKLFNIKAQ
jgi:hypothetical protein